MKLRPWLLLPAAAVLVLLLKGGDYAPSIVSADPPALSGDFAPGELLVKVRPGLTESTAVTASLPGSRAMERIPGLDVFRIDLAPELRVAEAAGYYAQLPWVEFAEPNYYVRADIEPDDPCYASGFPCPGTQLWYYDLIEAPAAWDITTGSPDVVVAVLDSGIDLENPDLAAPGKLWVNTGEIPSNGIDDDGNTIVDDVDGAAFVSLPTTSAARDRLVDVQVPVAELEVEPASWLANGFYGTCQLAAALRKRHIRLPWRGIPSSYLSDSRSVGAR